MKRRVTVVTAAVLLAGAMLVGVTYAYLVSRASPLVNTFVSGDIEISLTESTGSTYTLVPGCTLQKDPRITVKDGSEECWLFFRLEDETPEGIVDYSPDDGWNALSGEAGVYWRRVSECREDKVYSILKGDCITVVPTATEEKHSKNPEVSQ